MQTEASTDDLDVLTPWHTVSEGDHPREVKADTRKHALLRAHALGLLQTYMPWLVPILRASRAQVLAMQGHLYISLPDNPADWIEIPELSACLRLMPWADEGETAH